MASGSSNSAGLYTAPAVQRPTIEQMRSVAEAMHLHIPADELEQYRCKLLLQSPHSTPQLHLAFEVAYN